MSKVSARILGIGLVVGWMGASLQAREYDFKDPKGVNAIHFLLDSTLEPIMGLASGISGKMEFDPAAPEKTTGQFTMSTSTLHIENPRMTQVLHSRDWMDVERFPTIELVIRKIKAVRKPKASVFELDVEADFTCKGITKPIELTIRATHLPGRLPQRVPGMKGDLLVLRSFFSIKRTDFNIKPSTSEDSVADEIQLAVVIAGMAPDR